MQYPQTRYQDSLAVGITDVQLTYTCALTPPTRTQGITTVGRLQSNVEDVFYNGVAGNVVTISLRGLSQTALTPTTLLANQKNHSAGESLEITTHHNYDTDLLRKTENDTVTGTITFSGTGNSFTNGVKIPSILDTNGITSLNLPATASAVNNLRVQNSITTAPVIITTEGGDTNISLELQAKGTGVVTLPDASLLKTAAAPTANAQIANKKYVDDQIATITQQSNEYDRITYGDTIAVNDLLYEDFTDGKWKKVTATTSTWYSRLALAQVSGVDTDANKLVLRRGVVTGLTFNNINPTFTSVLTGTDVNVGDANADSAQAFVVNNTSGAEAIVTGGTISAKQVGTPAGAMRLELILEQQEQTNSPAAFKDTAANVMRGAIIATATIAQANFSGVYQNLAFSFGGNIKIPAGARVYLVISKTGAISGANYYIVQSNAATRSLDQSTQTWSGTANAGNIALTVTSTSPIGYSIKTYTGSDGSFGLTPSNPWSRVIGQVLSSTSMYFDPEWKRDNVNGATGTLIATAASGFSTVNAGFCPSQLKVFGAVFFDATTDISINTIGRVRGDVTGATTFNVEAFEAGGSVEENYVNPPAGLNGGAVADIQMALTPNGSGTGTGVQNKVYAARLENGFYLYNGYPAGTTFISGNLAGFTKTNYSFVIDSKI